jgi:hypothetical protein
MSNRVDYIVSLVGKNPMPSFITALNYLECNPKIFLVHTEKSEGKENIGTKRVAENIKEVLMKKNNQLTIELKGCDKSNLEKIAKVVNSIIDSVKKDLSENKKHEEIILLLDYSGGTKAMSAVFYERMINFKENIIYTVTSYIDDKIIKLYSKSKNTENIKIKQVFKEPNISIEDITKLHGYKIKKYSNFNKKVICGDICYFEGVDGSKIIFENGNKEQEVTVDGAAFLSLKGSIVFCFDSKIENDKRQQKFELFKIKYYANKLGGSKSIFLYRSRFINNKGEDYKEDLKNEIVRFFDYEMRDRCHLINKNMSFEETIKIISKL